MGCDWSWGHGGSRGWRLLAASEWWWQRLVVMVMVVRVWKNRERVREREQTKKSF